MIALLPRAHRDIVLADAEAILRLHWDDGHGHCGRCARVGMKLAYPCGAVERARELIAMWRQQ